MQMLLMRILHVIGSVDPELGGPSEGIAQMGMRLKAQGHCVEVVSLDPPGACVARFPLRVCALGPSVLRYGFNTRLVPWLRQHAGTYDIVIVNGIWGYSSFASWLALSKSSTPYVVFTHGMLDPWFKYRYPLKHLKKWMYWPWADYWALRDAAAVIFTCEEERVLARQSFWLYRANERVATYGTSAPQGDPEIQKRAFYNRFPHLEGQRVVLFMGRIHPKKGCDLAIEAFARVLAEYPNWQLVMAGPDQVGWQSQLQLMAERFDLSNRITWAGMVQGDAKWGAFRAAEVLLLPSHQENFGIVVAEALACGVPALISNKVNIWREVESDGAGLVAEDNVAGTANLLRTWAGMSDDQRVLMRHRAKICFDGRFEIDKVAVSILAILSSLTGSMIVPEPLLD
jgi:glycosyltransferase involved in cell wall biosynthesis